MIYINECIGLKDRQTIQNFHWVLESARPYQQQKREDRNLKPLYNKVIIHCMQPCDQVLRKQTMNFDSHSELQILPTFSTFFNWKRQNNLRCHAHREDNMYIIPWQSLPPLRIKIGASLVWSNLGAAMYPLSELLHWLPGLLRITWRTNHVKNESRAAYLTRLALSQIEFIWHSSLFSIYYVLFLVPATSKYNIKMVYGMQNFNRNTAMVIRSAMCEWAWHMIVK